MLTPRKVLNALVIIFAVYIITIAMATIEVLWRAKEAYNEGKECYMMGLEWEKKGDCSSSLKFR